MIQIGTLKEFYALMDSTIETRKKIVSLCLDNAAIGEDLILPLREALTSLEAIEEKDGQRCLSLGKDKEIKLDISYEVDELKKDIFFLTHAEEKFIAHLESIHKNFAPQVKAVEDKLAGIKFATFITDRDGTVNNYCGRYVSSVQSIYNAVFLTRFARKATGNSIILTSAPLDNVGLADISVAPRNDFIYAGSKGREYFNKQGERRQFAIKKEKQVKLDMFNNRISSLTKEERYEMFTLIGSGLQFKFGQTTIARQDITNTIPEQDSLAFMRYIENIVYEIDPHQEFFRIEDTGKDIEIILTIESKDSDEEAKDFDKGDGVDFLNKDLHLKMNQGASLICGDTSSDVPMIPASLAETKETFSVFVTVDDKLKEKVRSAHPDALFVDTPDMLVAALNNLGK